MNPETDNFLFREGPIIRPRQSLVEQGQILWKNTIIGKLHADVYTEELRWLIEIIRSAWNKDTTGPTSIVTIRDLGHNCLSFTFQDEEDKLNIMRLRPWKFLGHLLVLNEWRPNIPTPKLTFTTSPFWIQAHDLPCELMSRDMGMDLGKIAGEVLEVDFNETYEEREKYVRILVMVDITKRLPLGCWLFICEDNIIWVSFRYERLPKICYRCGVLGHIKKDCKSKLKPLIENYVVYSNGEKPVEGDVVRDMNKRGYGPWVYEEVLEEMRAEYEDFEDEDQDMTSSRYQSPDRNRQDHRVRLDINHDEGDRNNKGTAPMLVKVEESSRSSSGSKSTKLN